MLPLHILTVAVFANIQAKTSDTHFLVRRSPNPTGSASIEKEKVASSPVVKMPFTDEQLKRNEELESAGSLLVLLKHNLPIFEPLVPATKLQRTGPSPTVIEIGQIPDTAPSRAIRGVEEGGRAASTRSLQTTKSSRTSPAGNAPTKPIPTTLQPDDKVSYYSLLRNLTTVNEVWQEYKYGLNGNPSIESLNANYARRWINSGGDLKYYFHRNKIYNYIANEGNKSADEAVKELESLRIEHGWSLNDLQFNIPSLMRDESNGKLFATKPIFRLEWNLTTVPEVWQEYKYGRNGAPSVEDIVRKDKIKWLKSHTERNIYYGRKKLYDYIKAETETGRSENDVVGQLEQLRVDKNWKLSDLQLNISNLSFDSVSGQLYVKSNAYKLLRNLTTVKEVWQEYKDGLYGNPRIESLVFQFGTSWIKGTSDRQYYYKRKLIYDYINNAAQRGQSETETINELESLMKRLNWTLPALQFQISTLSRNEGTGELVPAAVVFKLLRNLTTVPEVWQEYKYGLNGNPSVEAFTMDHGIKWLISSAEESYYYHRKKIYDYIKNAMIKGKPEADAVKELEDFRINNKLQLSALQSRIKIVKNRTATGFEVILQDPARPK